MTLSTVPTYNYFIIISNLYLQFRIHLFFARLNFKQYIRNKWSGFGVRFFSLCEESDYLWNTYVYVGRDTRDEDSNLIKHLGKSGAFIFKLMSDLFGKGYHLYVDNWYTSENLVRYLLDSKTLICGIAMPGELDIRNQ